METSELTAEETAEQKLVRQRVEYVHGLHALAAWLEDNPDMIDNPTQGITVYRWPAQTASEDAIGEFRRQAERLDNPSLDSSDSYFNATQKFGPHKFQVTLPTKVVITKHPLVDDDA